MSEDVELRLGRCAIAVFDNVAEGIEFFVKHGGECERAFGAFAVHLDELLFDIGHLLIHVIGRLQCGLDSIVGVKTRVQSFDLRFRVPNFVNRLVQLRNPIDHLARQLELFWQFSVMILCARIDNQLQRRSLCLSAGRHFDLIIAR